MLVNSLIVNIVVVWEMITTYSTCIPVSRTSWQLSAEGAEVNRTERETMHECPSRELEKGEGLPLLDRSMLKGHKVGLVEERRGC